MSVKRLLPCLLVIVAFPAAAEVYKCRAPDGSTQISTSPCAGGSKTIKAVEEEVVSDEDRARAERNAERQRQRADKLEAERRAEETEERRELQRERQSSGAPSAAAVQHCLNTLNRMNLDSTRRAELETGCYATGRVEPVYDSSTQPYYYGGGGYYPGYPRPPRPVPPIAPVPPPRPGGKPPDLYKVPTAPRGPR